MPDWNRNSKSCINNIARSLLNDSKEDYEKSLSYVPLYSGTINKSVDIDCGITLLHIAVEKNNVEVVRLILKFKPNIHVKDIFGRTPYQLAVEKNNLEILELFNEHKTRTISSLYESTKLKRKYLEIEQDQITKTNNTLMSENKKLRDDLELYKKRYTNLKKVYRK